MNKGIEKENNAKAEKPQNNIADLENNHEALKQKAKEMFADLDLDDDFAEKEEKK